MNDVCFPKCLDSGESRNDVKCQQNLVSSTMGCAINWSAAWIDLPFRLRATQLSCSGTPAGHVMFKGLSIVGQVRIEEVVNN